MTSWSNLPIEKKLKKLISCKVPVVCTLSDSELENFGVVQNEIISYMEDDVTGDIMHENRRHTLSHMEFTNCMRTIRSIIEIYTSGYPIRLTNKDDVKYVYDTVAELIDKGYEKDTLSVYMLNNFLDDILANNTGELVRNAVEQHGKALQPNEQLLTLDVINYNKTYQSRKPTGVLKYPSSNTNRRKLNENDPLYRKRPKYNSNTASPSDSLHSLNLLVDKTIRRLNNE